MMGMFYSASAFNQDISAWDKGAATTMYRMFAGASAFIQVLCWNMTGKDTEYMSDSTGGGSADTTTSKCACPAGAFYDSISCSPCASGTVSSGKTCILAICCATGVGETEKY